MKRNDIYNILESIMRSLYIGQTDIAAMKLHDLIIELDIDRHTKYDKFEMLEDLDNRATQLENQLNNIKKDIIFMKDNKNLIKNRK